MSKAPLNLRVETALKARALTVSRATGLSLTNMAEAAYKAIADAYERDGFLALPLRIVPANLGRNRVFAKDAKTHSRQRTSRHIRSC